MKLLLNSLEDTKTFAQKIAENLSGGEVIFLIGNLGSGKTSFTILLAQALGVDSRVKSPTYVLFQKYSGKNLNLYHFDLYRLEKKEGDIDIDEIGLTDALTDDKGVIVIEWADLLKGSIKERIELKIKTLEKNIREVEINPIGEKYTKLAEKLKK